MASDDVSLFDSFADLKTRDNSPDTYANGSDIKRSWSLTLLLQNSLASSLEAKEKKSLDE